MKFLGVLFIISGALYAITIVGIIVAWLPIWIGILLFQSGTAAEEAYYNGSEYDLVKSLEKIKTFFTIWGVLAILSIVSVIPIMILFFTFVFMSQSGNIF